MSKKALLRHLNAMGITTYVRRDEARVATPNAASVAAPPAAATTASPTESPNVPNESRAAASPVTEESAPPASAATAPPTQTESPMQADASTAWKKLAHEVASCEQCVLHKTRTQTVFGVGDNKAQWMFIGEGPGADEDAQGEPFVGRAGQLLTKMLSAIGLARDEVYIANIVKCRPPDNRNPRPEEISSCIGYLHRQIAMVRPEIIVCLGGVAAHALLQTEESVGRMRGRAHAYPPSGASNDNSSDALLNNAAPEDAINNASVSVVVTYHPAYLLRSPTQKKATWEDLQFACRMMGRAIPERKMTASE